MDQAAASRVPGRGVAAVAAIAFACSGVTALFNFYVYIILPSQPGHFSYDIFGVIYLLVPLDVASVLLSVGAGVLALGMALLKRERLAAISFGLLLAAAAFAAYACRNREIRAIQWSPWSTVSHSPMASTSAIPWPNMARPR